MDVVVLFVIASRSEKRKDYIPQSAYFIDHSALLHAYGKPSTPNEYSPFEMLGLFFSFIKHITFSKDRF